MPRPSRPRKSYRPRTVRLDAHLHAVDRIATLLPHQREQLARPTAAALDAFRRGAGSVAHWRDLADACNVAEALAELHIGGAPLLPAIQAAQAALAAVHGRHAQRGSWTLRGQEITALDEACYWHAWQLEQATQGELHDAIERVRRRTAGALAGSVGAGTVVCVGGLTTTRQEASA